MGHGRAASPSRWSSSSSTPTARRRAASPTGLPGLNIDVRSGRRLGQVRHPLAADARSRVTHRGRVEGACRAMKNAILVPVKHQGHEPDDLRLGPAEGPGRRRSDRPGATRSCMQSNEGFPTARDLLTREVNEYEGQHRFGGRQRRRLRSARDGHPRRRGGGGQRRDRRPAQDAGVRVQRGRHVEEDGHLTMVHLKK